MNPISRVAALAAFVLMLLAPTHQAAAIDNDTHMYLWGALNILASLPRDTGMAFDFLDTEAIKAYVKSEEGSKRLLVGLKALIDEPVPSGLFGFGTTPPGETVEVTGDSTGPVDEVM